MKDDPFGNLTDWGMVLDVLDDFTENKKLSQCQHGLIRILRYKGNWRLREEVLKRVGDVQSPSKDLVTQIIRILDDDNIYYDARIIAGDALVKLLGNSNSASDYDLYEETHKVIEKLKSIPHPPFFSDAIDRLHSELTAPSMLEN